MSEFYYIREIYKGEKAEFAEPVLDHMMTSATLNSK